MFKRITIKDILFVLIILFWLIANISEYFIAGYCFMGNVIFIVLMCLILIAKINSPVFNEWLETVVYESEDDN